MRMKVLQRAFHIMALSSVILISSSCNKEQKPASVSYERQSVIEVTLPSYSFEDQRKSNRLLILKIL